MSKIKDLINDDKPREQAKTKGIENLTNSSLEIVFSIKPV